MMAPKARNQGMTSQNVGPVRVKSKTFDFSMETGKYLHATTTHCTNFGFWKKMCYMNFADDSNNREFLLRVHKPNINQNPRKWKPS